MQYIYDNIMYAELNTKSDYCQVCGFDGEIKIVEDDGKLVWECPHCATATRKSSTLHVAPAAILEPSSGTRVAPKKSAIACFICSASPHE